MQNKIPEEQTESIEKKEGNVSDQYIQDGYDRQLSKFIQGELEDMLSLRNQTWPQFNGRTLNQFIDDSEKRLNAQIISKEAQGKEDWQSNVALPTVRDRTNRMIAGFSLTVPDMEVKAFGETYDLSIDRAEIAKWLITGSYLQEENPVLDNFWEAWSCSAQGTVVKYEGYLKTSIKKKHIDDFDLVTGRITFTEVEVNVDDKCISYLVPLTELFIKDFTVHKIQDQESLCWVRYISKELFDYEFSKYPKAKHVLTKSSYTEKREVKTHFYDNGWMNRVKGNNQVEVIRYYNRLKDMYVIEANGIILLSAPLLWEVNGVKCFPFAKTIWAPFTNYQFFYGNSIANVFMSQYDNYNTAWNTVMDKEFRSMIPFLVVGRANQDALDLEDNLITMTTKITVDDVSQIKELQLAQPNSADFEILKLIAAGINEASPDLSSLIQNKSEPTAREIVIAEEKLQEIKTIHQEMLSDLWRQKYMLRLANIQLNYPQPRTLEVRSESGELTTKEFYRTYIIPNATLDKETGERGILAIQFRPYASADKRKIADEISVEEQVMQEKGVNFKKQVVQPYYLDNYFYQIEVITGSLSKLSTARMQSSVLEKLSQLQQFFPQIFVLNQDDLFKDFAKAYNETPDRYLQKVDKFREAKMSSPEGNGATPLGQPPGQPAPEMMMQ